MYNPGKLCPKKNLPVLGSFFVDARLPAPDFFLLESKYKIQVRKIPRFGASNTRISGADFEEHPSSPTCTTAAD